MLLLWNVSRNGFLFQFEINAQMDISKNQYRSTGGYCPDMYTVLASLIGSVVLSSISKPLHLLV